jgi:hypothetical protein
LPPARSGHEYNLLDWTSGDLNYHFKLEGPRTPGLRDPDAGEHGNVTRPLIVGGNKARSRRVSFGDQGTKARITPTEKETS